MNNGLWMVVATAGLALAGCGGHHSHPAASAPSVSMPTDFVNFVTQQVQQTPQPAFGTTPASTTSLTTDLGVGNATAFANATFGTGNALPTGTNQASVACAQAGTTACDPSVSADLNSNLN